MAELSTYHRAIPGAAGVGSATLTHPEFDRTALSLATAIVDSYSGNWVLNRLANDRGRFMVGLLALALSSSTDGPPGFTIARFRAEAAVLELGSPGRIAAIIAALRLFGALSSTGANQRGQRLMPTERFLAGHRARWRRLLLALLPMQPDVDAAIAALDDPWFLGLYANVLVDLYRNGERMLERAPQLAPLVERDAGLTLLLSLYIADATGQPVSIAELARRFSVSRAHVMKVFRAAQPLGLTIPAGERGGYSAGPALKPVLAGFFAKLMALHFHATETAIRIYTDHDRAVSRPPPISTPQPSPVGEESHASGH